jgi:hypothetical protein
MYLGERHELKMAAQEGRNKAALPFWNQHKGGTKLPDGEEIAKHT